MGLRAHRLLYSSLASLPDAVRSRALSMVFNGVHASRRDPWSVDSSNYEHAKQSALLSAASQFDPRVTVELGCSVGGNLLPLADALPGSRVIGVDISSRAVAAARRRTQGSSRVQVSLVRHLNEVSSVVGAPVDLLVVSEVLYYLGGPRGVLRALSPLRDVLAPAAAAVLVHSSKDAPALHQAACQALGMEALDTLPGRSTSAYSGFSLTCARVPQRQDSFL